MNDKLLINQEEKNSSNKPFAKLDLLLGALQILLHQYQLSGDLIMLNSATILDKSNSDLISRGKYKKSISFSMLNAKIKRQKKFSFG